MLRHPILMLLLIALLCPTSPAQAGEQGAERVDALLTLRFDPDSQSVLWPEVHALLHGSPRAAWGGKLPAQLVAPPESYRTITVQREDTDDPGVLCVRVSLRRIGDAGDAIRADRIFDALVARVRRHIEERVQRERAEWQAEAASLEAAIEKRTQTIASSRAEGALPWPLSAAAFYENKLERRADVQRQLTDLALDAATLEARRETLLRQHEALLRREAKAKTKDGDIVREWGAIVDTREQFMLEMRARLESAVGSPLDLAQAQEDLARARIQRAEALRVILAPSDRRLDLEADLNGLAIDASALDATRKHLQVLEAKLTAEIEDGKMNVLRVSRMEDESQLLRERLLRLRERLAAWRAPQLDTIRLD